MECDVDMHCCERNHAIPVAFGNRLNLRMLNVTTGSIGFCLVLFNCDELRLRRDNRHVHVLASDIKLFAHILYKMTSYSVTTMLKRLVKLHIDSQSLSGLPAAVLARSFPGSTPDGFQRPACVLC